MSELIGVAIFMALILIGMALVSVHYRNKYEEIKYLLEIKKNIQEAPEISHLKYFRLFS